MQKLKPGDTIWYREYKRRNEEGENVRVTVDKIGKKYLTTIEKGDRIKVSIYTLKYESPGYSQNNIQFYRTEQEINDLLLEWELSRQLREKIGTYGTVKLTLSQLKRIIDIVNENQKEA